MGRAHRVGPRPAAPERPLSASRSAVVSLLRAQTEPVTLAALMRVTELHENTLREHLTALVNSGLVRRERSDPAGRGRPPWRYSLTDPSGSGSEYARLASALASAIAVTSSDPARTAAAAGDTWGRELARDRGAAVPSPALAHHKVLHLLDELGYAPEEPEKKSSQEVRLTRCPLLEAATKHPDIVCAVHLGIVRGALSEYGAQISGLHLAPFAEPGACLLTMPPQGEKPK